MGVPVAEGCTNTLDNSMSVDIVGDVTINCVGLLSYWPYC